MYRFLLTPRWWGIHVFVLLAIPFCVFMGSWQLSRFEDRVDTHKDAEATAEAHADGAARPLAKVLPVTTETSGERTRATGRYVKQLLVPDRGLDGADGYYVLGLLRTGEDKVLPVVRGWHEGPAPAKAPAAPTGTVTVTGALQPSEDARSTGVNASGGLPAGQVGIIGAASLVNLTSYDVYDGWITLDRAEAGLNPVPAKAPEGGGLDLKAFQNLGYTGEWFVFAGFVVFMWYRLVRREAEALRDAALGIAAEEEPEPEPAGV
ncbi:MULTISPECIES: SURF1 family protein [unclassified Streptomyces]|uniref:SURF1 family protein n=1 Tax=unclassified Streptomyces TaxID=2593676 RepID=UPI00081F58F9|nr:SURF1 family protein [Streptomyces sp. LcepLS]MYR30190.1 SURF1 family protein [Streptomyces sp. SID4945]SCF48941.1 Cytochrome oxidase assembly protein ShyY1 [Streptomyces sp. LcepLS]